MTDDVSVIDELSRPPLGRVAPPTVTQIQELPFGQLTWENFEKLCVRLAQLQCEVEHCDAYGTRGQAQEGIDIYLKPRSCEKYWTFQCKRENDFNPTKIRKAITKFLNGSWAARSERFYLCTKEALGSTECQEEIERQRDGLSKQGIQLLTWDANRLSRLLKTERAIVMDFFGHAWVAAFCVNSPAASTSDNSSVIFLIQSVRNALKEGRQKQIQQEIDALRKMVESEHLAGTLRQKAILALAEYEQRLILNKLGEHEQTDPSSLAGLIDRLGGDLVSADDHDASRLLSIRATVAEVASGADAAIQTIGAPDDPIKIRATLGVLIRAGRFRQGVDLISDLTVDERWCDVAAFIFAALGKIDQSLSCVQRSNEFSISAMRGTHFGFAEGIVSLLQGRIGDDSLLAPRTWPTEDRKLAKLALDKLEPLIATVESQRGNFSTDLDLYAVQFGITFAHLIGDEGSARKLSRRLIRHRPIPLVAVELALRGSLDHDEYLPFPSRLRLEHPGKFQPALMAALVERELLDRTLDSFDAAIALESQAVTEKQKEALSWFLFETSGRCPPERIDDAIKVVARLRPTDDRLLRMMHVSQLTWSGNLEETSRELQSLRDENDPVWWQAYAQLLERQENNVGAAEAWLKAAELLPHPDVLRRSVAAMFDRRRYRSAIRNLEKLVELDPNSQADLRNLARVHYQLGEYSDAVPPLRRLVELDPTSVEHRMGLATCLARVAQLHDATEVLRPACARDGAPYDAIMLQSQLLESDGQASEAFGLLNRILSEHWDDPQFLVVYVHRGHTAGEDREAHRAFARLLELRGQGLVPRELMQAASLEQLLEHGKEYQARRETLQNAVVAGRMPWLFAEEVLRNPPVVAWALHTQELNWLADDPLNRAAFSVYATNGFTVCPATGNRRLVEITSSPKLQEVVADVSALVTLQQLGRLESAAEHFGRILLPASYGTLLVRDADRFGLHQPSRQKELDRIRAAVDGHRVRLVEGNPTELRLLDEYSDESEPHPYRIQDLFVPLRSTQRASNEQFDELKLVAHKAPASDASHPQLVAGDRLLVSLLTLRTLAYQPIFESFLATFRVHLRSADHDAVVGELRGYAAAAATRDAHRDLWDKVAALVNASKISWCAVPHDEELDDEASDEDPSIDFDAIKLARHENKPLIVDDRVLQVVMFNSEGATPNRAFGTDRVLMGMLEEGNLDVATTAGDFRRLMNWRYRFLMPSGELLFEWAKQFRSNPPGDALLDAAVYLHDSLRDPGLHCGLEHSDPPMPAAAKFTLEWNQQIASFLGSVWDSDLFSDESAAQITRWVGEEMLPSTPRGLWYSPIGSNLARHDANSAFHFVTVRFGTVRKQRRAAMGLRILADALGMDQNDVLTATAEVIRGVKRQ